MPKSNESYFTTTIAGVEVCVAGDYDAPDNGVGWPGGFDINKVWVETDLQATDIQDILSESVKRQLEHEGFTGTAQAKREAKQDAIECRAEATRGIA
jgi:hypothetical protein